jgi:hypothetical protein
MQARVYITTVLAMASMAFAQGRGGSPAIRISPARDPISCGLCEDAPAESLTVGNIRRSVGTMRVYADRLVIGKRSAQPPLHDQTLVAS